jgi:hypothetical protein
MNNDARRPGFQCALDVHPSKANRQLTVDLARLVKPMFLMLEGG